MNRPIVPQPKTCLSNVLPRLNRYPVVSLREGYGLCKRNYEITAARVRVLKSARNQSPWQIACAILVKENVKRRSRPGAVIFCAHIHFGDLPYLSGRHDEVVSGLAIEKIQRCFGVLRRDVRSLLCRKVVILIVEDVSQGSCWCRACFWKCHVHNGSGWICRGEQRHKESSRDNQQRGYEAQIKEAGLSNLLLFHVVVVIL